MPAKTDCSELPVTEVRGVGQRLASKLGRLGILSVQDLLFHLPFRYEDRTRRTAIGAVRPGQRVLIIGRVEHSAVAYGRRRSLISRISDGTGSLDLRLFYFSKSQQSNLKRGSWVCCYGEVRHGRSALEMVHPEYRLSPQEPPIDTNETLTPVYPSTGSVSQNVIRRIVGNALESHAPLLNELIPDELLEPMDLPRLEAAVVELHMPDAGADLKALATGSTPAQRRLSIEELLAHHLSFQQLRAQRNTQQATRSGGCRRPGVQAIAGPELRTYRGPAQGLAGGAR